MSSPHSETQEKAKASTGMKVHLEAGIYEHYKGGLYQVLGVAGDSSNGSDGRLMVVYIGLSLEGAGRGPRMHVREYREFMSWVHVDDGSVCAAPGSGSKDYYRKCHERGRSNHRDTAPRFVYAGTIYKGDHGD